MKPSLPDVLGIAYPVTASGLLLGFSDDVAAATAAHPFLMGFAKFAVLATYGECLKARMSTGRWLKPRLLLRAIVWGLFGIWIGADFTLIDAGVKGLIARGQTPEIGLPFWLSLWANILSGYALFMMFTHYWIDHLIDGERIWPWQLFGRPESVRWAKVVLISMVVFWLPAHSFTFSLDPHLRLISAAYLSVALGLILSFAARVDAPPAASKTQATPQVEAA